MNSLPNRIPDATVRRFSLYLRFLEQCAQEGKTTAASIALAEHTGATAAQVRKDLQHLGSMGKRGLGYSVPELVAALRQTLGLGAAWRVALVGAGRIGRALVEYEPFRERGFVVTTVVDADPAKVGRTLRGVKIRSGGELERALAEDKTDLAILAVPAAATQDVADRVVGVGVKAVLNYAPVQLRVPAGVTLRNVSMLVEMESLSHALARSNACAPGPPAPGAGGPWAASAPSPASRSRRAR